MNLDINIVSARGLTEVDPTSKTKLYAVVSITGVAQKNQRAQTHVDGGGGNPTWNFPAKFVVDVEGLKQDHHLKTRLVFALKCEDGRGERDLGEVHVAVAELMQSGTEDGNYMRYVAVSYPVRKPSGEAVGLLNFEYKFGGSPMIDTPAAGYATSMGVYPPQGYNYPPPQQAAGYGGYPPPAAGYGGHQPPSQPSGPYRPSSPSHYTPLAYPPYNVGQSSATTPSPSYYPSTYPYPYPSYNVGPSTPTGYPYPPYNVEPSATSSYAHPYPSHVQARASPVEQRTTPKKKKSVWGSALGVAGAVAVGVLAGVAAPSFEIPSVLAPDVTDLTAGFQIPDPSAYAPQDFSLINTFDPSALRDATYVDYSSLV